MAEFTVPNLVVEVTVTDGTDVSVVKHPSEAEFVLDAAFGQPTVVTSHVPERGLWLADVPASVAQVVGQTRELFEVQVEGIYTVKVLVPAPGVLPSWVYADSFVA